MAGLYSPKPRNFYMDPTGLGPGSMTLTMTEWNLLALFSRSLFSWDGSVKVPEDQRHGDFDPELVTAVRDSMHQRIGGLDTVANVAARLHPPEFLVALDTNSIGHLAVTKFWGSKKALMTVAEARMLTWFAAQPRKGGKVVNLRVLTPEQQAFIDGVNPWANGEIAIE